MLVLGDAFATATFLFLVGGVLVFLAIGRWHSRSGVDIMDEDREQRWGVQAHIEDHDIGEMVQAENARRERRGDETETVEDVVVRVGREELARLRSHERREHPTSD